MKIGLEIHVQLPTKSKMFCSCPTEGSDRPNSRVCPTCLGLPGSKPSLNRKAVELGLTIAKVLGCEIPETTWFSRKTYFYPDLCKHFQITQYDMPIGERGHLEVGHVHEQGAGLDPVGLDDGRVRQRHAVDDVRLPCAPFRGFSGDEFDFRVLLAHLLDERG